MLNKSLGHHFSKFDLELCARNAAIIGKNGAQSQVNVRTYAFVAL